MKVVLPSDYPRNGKYKLDLSVEAGEHRIEIPIILIRGARPGSTLVVTAGVHGDEYEGVRAIFDVTRELDPEEMAGDLMCAPVCNPPAFWNVSRCSPLDQGNLARVFPGNAAGSPTEAIAWHIDQQILRHADFYLDLHSAGMRWIMPTMVGYEARDARAEAAARVFGAPVIWAHDVIAPGRTISAARERGIPWLYTEARGAGRIDASDLKVYSEGIWNLLRHLAIVPGKALPQSPQHYLYGDGNVDASVCATRSGFLIPAVELLDYVSTGRMLGTLTDLHGDPVETYCAPREGVVALIHACPLVEAGDPVFLVTGVR